MYTPLSSQSAWYFVFRSSQKLKTASGFREHAISGLLHAIGKSTPVRNKIHLMKFSSRRSEKEHEILKSRIQSGQRANANATSYRADHHSISTRFERGWLPSRSKRRKRSIRLKSLLSHYELKVQFQHMWPTICIWGFRCLRGQGWCHSFPRWPRCQDQSCCLLLLLKIQAPYLSLNLSTSCLTSSWLSR